MNKSVLGVFSFMVFVFSTMTLYSQNSLPYKSVDLGVVYNSPEMGSISKYITANDEGVFYLNEGPGFRKTLFSICKFDQNNKFLDLKEISIEYNDKDAEVYDVFGFNGKIYALSKYRNRKNKTTDYLISEIDSKDISKIVNTKEIFASPNVIGRDIVWSKEIHVISEDSSSIAFCYQKDQKGKESLQFIIDIYDAEFNLKSSNNYSGYLSSAYAEKLVDDKVYLLMNDSRGDYSCSKCDHLMLLSCESGNLEKYQFDGGDIYMSDPDMILDKEQNIKLLGFYSNLGDYNTAGYFYIKLNRTTLAEEYKVKHQFTQSEMSKILSTYNENGSLNKLEKGKDVELKNYILQDLNLIGESDVILIGERYTTYSGHGDNPVTYHDFYDIEAFRINDSGELIWFQSIEKYQSFIGKRFGSYTLHRTPNEYYFIFNGNIKNLEDSKDRKQKMSKGEPIIVVMTTDGQIKSSDPVQELIDADYGLATFELGPIKESEVIIYSKKRSSERIGVIKF